MPQQPVEVRAPEAQEEGTRSQVLRWLKAVGETVSAHEPLIELETDKVTIEVPAPASGVLEAIVKVEREEVEPGELLGRIVPAGAPSVASAEAPLRARPAAAAAAPTVAPSAAVRPADALRLSPAVRRLLSERGLEPGQVRGTGEGGRITVDDVLALGPDLVAAQPSVTQGDAAGARRESEVPVRRVPHTAVRKRIASRMVESLLRSAPHVTNVFEVDLAAVLEHRARHRQDMADRGVSLTLTAYFVRAAIEAIGAVPEANSRWGEEALEIYETVNFGIGTAAPEGLVAPVLQGAERLDLERTAAGIGELVQRAREGRLRPQDVRGGTFTLSNHGVSGSLIAAPIILFPGQAAILGVGKVEKRAVVVGHGSEERIEIRPRCYATLTIDHRVMDGERANRFMQVFTERLAGWSE
ncbi:MAG: dihydrolipoamide acetyltransferase family protein [Steroidobacteraceae bacterium]